MQYRVYRRLNYFNVLITYLVSFLVLWILPFLFGKYADCSFPFVPKEDIIHELVGLLGPTKNGNNWCSYTNAETMFENKFPELEAEALEVHRKEYAKRLKIAAGGEWKPSDCQSRYQVVIIVPYRDRPEHLKKFLRYMHPFLQGQKLHYRILVIEQNGSGPFNRGKLLNIGYLEVMRLGAPSHCIIFHDVDLLPLSQWNIYACTNQPRHMYSSVDTFRYHLPYRRLFGGAIAMQSIHFRNVNGFSNIFAGWGGEDDDLYSRLEEKGLHIIRFDPAVASYVMMPHHHALPSPKRWDHLAKSLLQLRDDGLSTVSYILVSYTLEPLYTRIKVAL